MDTESPYFMVLLPQHICVPSEKRTQPVPLAATAEVPAGP